MADFQAALRSVITWSVGDNQKGDTEKFPKLLKLGIPVEAIPDLCEHLMALADNADNHKTITVWDFGQRQEKSVSAVALYAKGKEGPYGSFGNINPAKVQTDATIDF